MTAAPDRPDTAAEVDEIAAALRGWQSGNHGARTIVTDGQALDFAERVLPVVERLQRQAAAAERERLQELTATCDNPLFHPVMCRCLPSHRADGIEAT